MYRLLPALFIVSFLSCERDSKTQKPVAISENGTISISYSVKSERKAFVLDTFGNNHTKYLSEINCYDEKNNLIEHQRISKNGSAEEHIVYLYKDGRISEEYRLETSSSDALWKTIYTYSKDGKLSFTITSNYQKRIKTGIHKGIAYGNCMVLPSDFDSLKTWGDTSYVSFRYDKKGNLIDKKTTGYTDEEHLYVYVFPGNIIEETWLIKNNLYLKGKTIYFPDSSECVSTIYNSDGSVNPDAGSIEKKKFSGNKSLLDEQFFVEGKGPELYGIKNSDDQLYKRLYKYDEQNRVVSEEYITNIGSSIFTTYEYSENPKSVNKIMFITNN